MTFDSSWLIALADPLSARGNDLLASLPPNRKYLATGLAQLIGGDTARSRVTFEDEYRGAAQARDGERARLALALGWLAEVRHFNMFPGGCGGGSVELDLRWNGVERATAYDARARETRTWPGAASSQVEYRWVQFVTGRLPALATIRDAVSHPQKQMVLGLHVQSCELARDDARAVSPAAEPFVDRSIAEFQALAGDRAAADASLERAIAGYRSAADDVGVAGCLALGGDWAVAPVSSALVRNLMVADAGYPTSELAWMIEAVESATDGVDIDRARSAFDQARALYERFGTTRGIASVLLRLAYLARVEGQLDRQIALADEAAMRFKAADDLLHAQLARTGALLARLDARQFPEDREVAAAIGKWGAGSGSFSYALGLGLMMTRAGRQALLRDGDYEKAEACYQLALALNRALGAHCRQSQTLADLASLHQALGNRRRSQTQLDEAIDVLLPESDDEGLGHGLLGQRAALLVQQAYREALDHRDHAGMERALTRLARISTPGNDVAAFAVAGFIEETRQQGPVLIALYKGVAARNDGDDGTAETWFDQALAAARGEEPVNSLFLQAMVHATRRRYAEAVQAFDAYQQAVAAGAGLGSSLLSAMRTLSDVRAQQEVQIADRRSVEQRFSFMVRVKAYERAAEDLGILQRVAGADWWADDDRPWRSLSDIAEMHEGLGQFRDALDVYSEAIDQLERRRSLLSRDELKTALAADFGVQYLYFQAVRAALKLVREQAPDEQRRDAERRAFALSEKARARALLDLLAANVRQASSTGQESAAFRRWRQLTSSSELWRGMLARARSSGQSGGLVEVLQAKIEDSERELYGLEETIHGDAAQSLSASAAVISLEEAVSQLAPDTAILQYMSLGDELLVWAVTSSGMAHAHVDDLRASVLGRLVREFQSGCASGRSLELLDAHSRKLARYLLDPVGPVIDAHEKLHITPYGELNSLPFAALKWKGQWLGHQRTLTYLPSASMLQALARPSSTAPQEILAVGNPRMMTHQPPFGEVETLPPLEFAEAEATSVARLYGGTALTDAQASIDEIRPRLRAYRRLHFATHGLLYDEAPLLSGIALADGYVLTVQELMGITLDADVVVVSACRSGLGARTGGEEIVGLSRGLLAAGARAVIVSLWSVPDRSTAILMVRFHQNVRDGMDVAKALQEAAIWLSELDSDDLAAEEDKLRDMGSGPVQPTGSIHPRQWAPFVVIGV